VPRPLGQHFLKSDAVRDLLAVIAPARGETFLEIGPGTGALTLPLAARCARLVAIELDAGLAARLRAQSPPNTEVLVADALETDWTALVPRGARLVGNLPYYISSPLLRQAQRAHAHFVDAHLLVQAEVADRVAAGPESRDYGILSVSFALWSEAQVVLRFPAAAFVPPPRVDSAVLRAVFRATPAYPVQDEPALERLVQRAFSQRRKTLENNLRDSYPNLKHYLRLLDIVGSRRAETLSVVEFARLAEALREGEPS